MKITIYPRLFRRPRSNIRVKVSLSNRMAYVMEGGTPLLIMPVTVGRRFSEDTNWEVSRIRAKTRDYRANTHGYRIKGDIVRGCYLRNKPAGWAFKGTPMPYWCEFKSAYGFHTGWMKPFPASGGCLADAQKCRAKVFSIGERGNSGIHRLYAA